MGVVLGGCLVVKALDGADVVTVLGDVVVVVTVPSGRVTVVVTVTVVVVLVVVVTTLVG